MIALGFTSRGRVAWAAFACFALVVLCGGRAAHAHLGGTASVDQLVKIERRGDLLVLHYDVDMAEFPGQMLRKRFDRRRDRTLDKNEVRRGLMTVARECVRGLILTIDGERVKLKPDRKSLAFQSTDDPIGTAAIPLRITMTFTAPWPERAPKRIVLENRLHADREVGFVRAHLAAWDGVTVDVDAKVAASIAKYEQLNLNIVDGRVVELPKGELPPQHRRIEWAIAPVAAESDPTPQATTPATTTPTTPEDPPTGTPDRDGANEKPAASGGKDAPTFATEDSRYFWEFFKRGDYGVWTLLGVLLMALFYGMGHALTPGHGKAITGAFLIGNRGTIWDAIVLGITVTITHTAAVFALGVAAEIATYTFRQDRVMYWLQLVSAALIIGLGLYIFVRYLWALAAGAEVPHGHSHFPGTGHTHEHASTVTTATTPGSGAHSHAHAHAHGHEHSHGQAHAHDRAHGHEHGHGHSHGHADVDSEPTERPRLWQIIYLGITGGMIPCPTGLVIISLAFQFHVLGLGLLLAAVFSLGMAGVLVAIGILTVKGYSIAERYGSRRVDAFFKVMPILSGLFITVIGFGFLAATMGWVSIPWLAPQG